MNIKECEEIINCLDMVKSYCPYEKIEGLEKHDCISSDSCINCWWEKLAEYIEESNLKNNPI